MKHSTSTSCNRKRPSLPRAGKSGLAIKWELRQLSVCEGAIAGCLAGPPMRNSRSP
jgi:hypothetical protein